MKSGLRLLSMSITFWLSLFFLMQTFILVTASDEELEDKNMIIKVTNYCSSMKLAYANTMYVGKWFAPTKYDRGPLNGTGTLEPSQSFQIGVSNPSRKENFAAGQILFLAPKIENSEEMNIAVGLYFVIPAYGHHVVFDEIFDNRFNEVKIEYTLQEPRMTSAVASINCNPKTGLF